MFVLWHVIWQLRLLRLQFVPPLVGAVLLVVSAAEIIKATPVSHRESYESRDQLVSPSAETLLDYKSQPLTIAEPARQSATTPITVQLLPATPTSSVTRTLPQDYEQNSNSQASGSASRRPFDSSSQGTGGYGKLNSRLKRGTYGFQDYLRDFGVGGGQLEYSPGLSEPESQRNFRAVYNSDCGQRILRGDGTVAKAIPCNHRWKYLDGQWEDSLYAEEPGYVVVRRETESTGAEDNASMDFIPIRGRKEMPSPTTTMSELHPMQLAQSEDDRIDYRAAAGIVVGPSKRDSRVKPFALGDTLWSTYMPMRGKRKTRINDILSKEDFLPNRGKKFLLKRINSLLRQRSYNDLVYPKRGKKTKHHNISTRPADLIWMTKDDFFPHRGKKFDDETAVDGTTLYKPYYDDNVNRIGYDADDGQEADYADGRRQLSVNKLSNGVIFGDRDSSVRRQNRELFNNLSKQEPRSWWRGRKRSVQADTGHYDNVTLRSALNENNAEDVAMMLAPVDSIDEAEDDQRLKLGP